MRKTRTWFPIVCVAFVACAGEADFEEALGGADAMPAVALETFNVDLGSEMAGAIVFSSETDGELIYSSITDAQGRVAITGRSGGMISFSQSDISLVSFIDIRSEESLHWRRRTVPVASETSLRISASSLAGADYNQVSACGRPRQLNADEPESLVLYLYADCLQADTVSVMAFAAEPGFPLAYAQHSVATANLATENLSLEWKTDFEETPLALAVPATSQVYARTTIADGCLAMATLLPANTSGRAVRTTILGTSSLARPQNKQSFHPYPTA